MGARAILAMSALAAGLWICLMGALHGRRALEEPARAGEVAALLLGGGAVMAVAFGLIGTWSRRRVLAAPLEASERVLADGWANRHGAGGWLLLTDRALVFRTSGLSVRSTRWPLAQLTAVEGAGPRGLLPGLLLLGLQDWSQVRLVVLERGRWEAAIAAARQTP